MGVVRRLLLKAMKDPRVEKVVFARLTEALVYLGIDVE